MLHLQSTTQGPTGKLVLVKVHIQGVPNHHRAICNSEASVLSMEPQHELGCLCFDQEKAEDSTIAVSCG